MLALVEWIVGPLIVVVVVHVRVGTIGGHPVRIVVLLVKHLSIYATSEHSQGLVKEQSTITLLTLLARIFAALLACLLAGGD